MKYSCCTFVACTLAICASAQDAEISDSVRDNLKTIYRRAAETMEACSPLFAAHRVDSKKPLTFETVVFPWQPKRYSIWGDLLVKVEAHSPWLCDVLNRTLSHTCDGGTDLTCKQTVPTLSPAAAIERARAYCKSFRLEVPPGFTLTDVGFGTRSRWCWDIRWRRFSGPYRWGDDDSDCSETMGVMFHEKHGLVSVFCNSCFPPPRSLDVKVSREEAIIKASKCVPLVERTPLYRQFRSSGFVANAVKWCDLRVVVPNWLLDPKRAMPRREPGPPKETRLCWVVDFTSVDAKSDERKDKDGKPYELLPREFTIYIDAASGDSVGADFK